MVHIGTHFGARTSVVVIVADYLIICTISTRRNADPKAHPNRLDAIIP